MKLEEKEREQIAEQVSKIQVLKIKVGEIDMQIDNLVEEKLRAKISVKKEQKALNEMTDALREKYGEVTINVSTGELTKEE